MEKIINYENLRSFAYVNDAVCKKPIKGIVVSFSGLGGMDMHDEDTKEGELYGEKGILYVEPYNNPWAWMNKQAVAYTDEILAVLTEKYDLPDNTPVISTGLSMGGLSALVYTAYAKRTPVACVANCPVCDAVFHYTERPDLPRTMYSALYNEEGTLEDALKSISPLHLVKKMPGVKYCIFHCDADMAVNIDAHSKKFVELMKAENHDISLVTVEGRGHCNLTLGMQRKFEQCVIESIENCQKGV